MTIRQIISFAFLAVVAIFGIGLTFGSFYRVDEGERAIVLTNGSFTNISEPGLSFKIPFIQSVRFISVRNDSGTIDLAAYSFDQQVADLKVSINYQIEPGDVEAIYRKFGSVENAVTRVVVPRAMERVKNVFGGYSAQRAIQERGNLNAEVTESIITSTAGSGITVTSVQIENIDFSSSYEEAVEAAAKAKADIERAKSELARVEQEAQQKVKQAEADATAKKLQADAEAYSTEAAGKATANAIRERGAALRDNPSLVDLVAAERWDGKLPTSMIPGGTVPFINLGKPDQSKTALDQISN